VTPGIALIALFLGMTAAPAVDGARVVLNGTAVCLDAAGGVAPCRAALERFGWETPDGVVHRLARAESIVTMLRDPRVRERANQVTGLRGVTGEVEVVSIRAAGDGPARELFYFCAVCNVRSYSPGPCPCCRGEMDLREEPVEGPWR
jgi:hypothetical protein